MRSEIKRGCVWTLNLTDIQVYPNPNSSGLNDTPRQLHLRVGGMFACRGSFTDRSESYLHHDRWRLSLLDALDSSYHQMSTYSSHLVRASSDARRMYAGPGAPGATPPFGRPSSRRSSRSSASADGGGDAPVDAEQADRRFLTGADLIWQADVPDGRRVTLDVAEPDVFVFTPGDGGPPEPLVPQTVRRAGRGLAMRPVHA